MIYLNLKGGLGNMMFQIAAAKAISTEKKTNYVFPNLLSHIIYLSSEKEYNPKVNYCHDYLKLPFLKDVKTEQPQSFLPLITYPFHFERIEINQLPIRIDGFFQSEKYFENYKTEIFNFFSPDEKILSYINLTYGHLLEDRTTSIHIRRGDYIKNDNYHFVQDLEYFNKSISLLESDTDRFLIFSDDINWCKENFHGENFFFVENEKDYNELYLMSVCKNNIISNSSFSWWGGWLNKNKNKIVVGPKNWFGESLKSLNTKDILPKNWIKV